MTTLTRFSALAAATLLTAAVLTGCAPTGGFDPGALGKTAKPSVSATPTPTAAAPKPGDTLTEAQAVALRKSLPKNGDWVYTTSAGVNLFINSHTPLPDVVKADAEAQLVASAQAGQAAGNNSTVTAAAKKVSLEVGKSNVVLVVRIWVFNKPGTFKTWQWVVPQGPAAGSPMDNRHPDSASAVAYAHHYIDAQPNAADWEVLVAG